MDKISLSKIISNDGKIKKFQDGIGYRVGRQGNFFRQVAFDLRDKM